MYYTKMLYRILKKAYKWFTRHWMRKFLQNRYKKCYDSKLFNVKYMYTMNLISKQCKDLICENKVMIYFDFLI